MKTINHLMHVIRLLGSLKQMKVITLETFIGATAMDKLSHLLLNHSPERLRYFEETKKWLRRGT